MSDRKFVLELSIDDLELLGEALDSHAYWQVSEDHERRDGYVYYPEKKDRTGKEDEDDLQRWNELDRIDELIESIRSMMKGDES